MTTRLTYRTNIRALLLDTSGTPLFTDIQVNSALANAAIAYSGLNPTTTAATIVTTAGVTSYALPAGVECWDTVALYDLDKAKILLTPEGASFPGATVSPRAQAWSCVNGKIELHAAPGAAEAGNWSLIHRTPRAMPADDVTAFNAPARDDIAIQWLAAAELLETRQVDELKRNPTSRGTFHIAAQVANWRTMAAHHIKPRGIRATSSARE